MGWGRCALTNPPSPTAMDRPALLRILRCIGLLRELLIHDLGVRYRRVFRSGRLLPQDWFHPLRSTPRALVQGCAADLGTALRRMERRFDALPEVCILVDLGPCFQRDASGNLQPNTDSDACMRDIESFQTARPKATLFDVELFHLGWEAGVKYGSGKSCSRGMEEKPSNPPDHNSILDSPHIRRRV